MTEVPEGLQTPPAAGTADNPPLLHAADAQGIEAEFNLDDLLDAPAPNFIAFGHDPDVPNPAAAAVLNAWALEDVSSDDDMYAPPETMAHFVKGHSVHGDVHALAKAMTRYIQAGRMPAYDMTRQVQA